VSGSPAPETSGSKPLALIVEAETRMRKFLGLALLSQGYGVVEAVSGREGLVQAATRAPDFILLDLGLPDLDGVEVTKQLREWTATPIIVVSARGQERKKVEALDAGADDYLTRPFGSTELMTRLRVALKHARPGTREATTAVVTVGSLRIDLVKRLVFVGDSEVHLTPTEYKLFTLLMKHSDKVLTQKQLLDHVWGPGHEEDKQSLRDCLMQLRKKLESNPAHPRYLLTEQGVGYRIKAPRDAYA
jgi:two-component system KDP operon response regulator KdpE